MSAVRARRPGRQPAKRKLSRTRPSAPQGALPRLIALKMAHRRGAAPVVTGKSLAVALAGAVLFGGAAIAGAAWLGQGLFDAREAFARSADGAAAGAGFTIGKVEISGVSGARADEVRALIAPPGRKSILSLDPHDVQARVQSLDWVEHVSVTRLWPSTLRVHVTRRQAFARWQENGHISLIDANGERLFAERAADYGDLPLVVGAGAGPAAEPLLRALEDLPQLRAHLSALVRVGERRWNVQLSNGATVELPEENPQAALAQLEHLQASHDLLDRPVAEMDLRAPGRLAVRVTPPLEGAPAADGGA
jgi:cell division protein FtsQ